MTTHPGPQITRAELEQALDRLSRIGGVYDYVRAFVAYVNEPHVEPERPTS